MLAEVALGKSVEVLEAEDFDFDKIREKDCYSLHGVGRMAPASETHHIMYNTITFEQY